MITYNNTLIAYFKANDTDFKKYLNEKFEQSNIASFIQFMDAFFYKLGLISTNLHPIEGSKWDAYYVLGYENIFSTNADKIVITDSPIQREPAEEKLAKKIIELFAFIDMSKVNDRITK